MMHDGKRKRAARSRAPMAAEDVAKLAAETKIEPLMTPAQTAELAQTTENDLYRHRIHGSGPPFIVVNKTRIRYRPSAVRAWLASREYTSMAAFHQADPDRAAMVEHMRATFGRAKRSRHRKPETAVETTP
jgi:hypothetical protein